MVYLIEIKHYSMQDAGMCIFWFEWGGLAGSLCAGWMSDLIFSGKRNPVNILFTMVILLLLFAFKVITHSSILLDSIFIFLFGFFIFGPQMLIGMAAAEMSHKKATATATGFVGYFAYLGAAVAGGPLGALTQVWGWDVYIMTLFGCGALAVVIMLPLWSAQNNPQRTGARG
jgi:OPA family sugar phosphate sensor protein UhpC-like MFS transporter